MFRPILPRALGLFAGAALLCGVLLHVAHVSIPPHATRQNTVSATSAPASADGTIPAAIHTTLQRQGLAVTLLVTPVTVGPARFDVAVREHGRRVTHGQVSIQLFMPTQLMFGRALLRAAPCAAGYCGQGVLRALGRWRVEVLVRLPGRVGRPLDIPFDVMNGPNARFLFAQPPDRRFGPATVRLARAIDGSSVLRVQLRPGLSVRAVLAMPNMLSMGTAVYAASAEPRGWYGVVLAFPMAGVTQVTLAVRTGGTWQPIRSLLYDVGSTGQATLLTNTAP